MPDWRTVLVGVGLAAIVLAVGVAVHPPLAAEFSVVDAGTGLVALVATVLGLVAAGRFARTLRTYATVEPPEPASTAPEPGGEVDELLAAIDADRRVGARRRDRLGRRLYATALSVLADHPDWSVEAAHTALLRGTWTDDPVAAALFAVDSDPGEDRGIVRSLLSPWSPSTSEQVRRTVTSLAEIADGERRPEPPETLLPRFEDGRESAADVPEHRGTFAPDPVPEWATEGIDL